MDVVAGAVGRGTTLRVFVGFGRVTAGSSSASGAFSCGVDAGSSSALVSAVWMPRSSSDSAGFRGASEMLSTGSKADPWCEASREIVLINVHDSASQSGISLEIASAFARRLWMSRILCSLRNVNAILMAGRLRLLSDSPKLPAIVHVIGEYPIFLPLGQPN